MKPKRLKLSIKARVTLWYTALMAVLVVLVAVIAVVMSASVEEMMAKRLLEQCSSHAAALVSYDGTTLTFSQPLDHSDKGVCLLFYDEHHQFLTGSWPSGFPDGVEASDTAFRSIEQNGICYFVYDRLLEIEQGKVWLRSIYTAPSNRIILSQILRLIFLALPLLVLLAAAGGWLITRNAFQTVEALRQQAEHISGGRDLSQRIPVGGGSDELDRLADTLNQMFDRLEQSFQAEQQFISDISHELRTPTAVILAECEYALKSADAAEHHKAFQAIQRQGKRISRMTEEMLTLSRMEQGQTQLLLEKIDLTELAEVVCEDQQEILPASLFLDLSLEQVTAEVNQDMMIRLLINLLSNAVRYANKTITVILRCENGMVELSVTDDGDGIAEQEQPYLFRRFYQSEQSRTHDKNSGLGLGLAMCEQIAQQHGGSISVSSALGKGSCFTVTFPQYQKGSNR